MLPEAKNENLLYIPFASHHRKRYAVYVYSFPGAKLVGKLAQSYTPYGECVDVIGDIYFAEGSKVIEYAHGGTQPIKTLPNPKSSDSTFFSCAIDRETGNLAVVAQYDNGGAYILVYPNGSGSPEEYTGIGEMRYSEYCTYDTRGDLFVLGTNYQGYDAELEELLRGRSSFLKVHLQHNAVKIDYIAGIQWHNNRLVIAGSNPSVVRLAVNGSKRKRAVETSQTPLAGSSDIGEFWIQSNWIAVPNGITGTIGIYGYPNGRQIKTISSGSGFLGLASAVSVAPK
jgi:hypothetical protein